MKLSVIVPVYNARPWLEACLGSVARALAKLASDGWTGELVCVDDGSTDGSSAFLESWAASHPAVRVLHEPNGGASVARNAGLAVATGDWVCFVDADDEVSEDWFAKLAACAAEAVDIVHANRRYCFQGVLERGRPGERWEVANARTLFLLDGWTVLNLVRRSLIGPTRFRPGLRLKEDVVFFTELALRGARVRAANLRGYVYRRWSGSALAQAVRDEDSRRFFAAIAELDLPRAEAARALGYDLAQWIKGRDWSSGYDPARCPVLKAWRDGIARGFLKPSDVRVWWRPGLRRWLGTGSPRLLIRTCRLRIGAERLFRRLLGKGEGRG